MKKIYFLFLLMLVSFNSFSQNPGDIVITEIMKDPVTISDDYGEWFEVHNTTGAPIDLLNWVIRDQPGTSQNSVTITSSVIVPAGGYITLGRGGVTDTASPEFNGGITHAYVYDFAFLMANGDDEVILERPDGQGGFIVIDEVFYTDANFPDTTGASMQLDSALLSGDNNSGNSWCVSTTVYDATNNNKGTPGAANNACAPTCQVSLGSQTATCDAQTSGVDTYNVSLSYTGAGNTTFIVTTTVGTIGGDNPTNVADGTITITGIPEGTDITITLNDTAGGGVCSLSRNVTSPVCLPTGTVDLELKGVLDFGLGASDGKAIHLVATADIADLSVYGLGSANNGGGTDGQEYTFPAQAVTNGSHILLVRNAAAMGTYLTTAGINLFTVVIVNPGSSATDGNGNDAVELFKNGSVVETFGDINDAVATSWNYEDSWAYKSTPGAVWPSGWVYGVVNCTDNTATIFDSTCIYPFVSSLSTENNSLENIGIYPNPVTRANKFVTITSKSSEKMDVVIYNILGKEVNKQTVTNHQIDISGLKKGFYLLKISQLNSVTTKKILIE
ncbi:lamin tail domain-containing protein [Polaribacter sp. BAL334]|uniref:lamin tail domain-containing protein n=1 Tax=Polaribacter sp. BAL334 TaxID=1708178 RepID=UPI0018D26956|nr:lamin tail domain-containing protein [Polaribacter sp. BAL334]MBG7611524.1 lamin tail domain-containing protein [Polaribacter sp. BAL334]